MRLVDADALIDIFEDRLEKTRNRYGDYSGEAGVCAGALHLIREQPTIEERKTGKWERKSFYDSTPVCPECGIEVRWDYEYCPYCGTKLEGEDDG